MAGRPILIVEDDADLIVCLRAVLEERYPIIAVSDGEAALAACESGPLLALVDLHIPGPMTGAELVASLRERLRPEARLILLSAERDLRDRADQLGADGFLEKPFEIEELLRLVEQVAGAPSHPPLP